MPSGSQKTWASIWVWILNEAGRHEFALGIDFLGAGVTDPADGGDAAVPHTDVGAVPGPP